MSQIQHINALSLSKEITEGHWSSLDEGVRAARFEVSPDRPIQLNLLRHEIAWTTLFGGETQFNTHPASNPGQLVHGDSTLMLWPRGDWQVTFNTQVAADVAVIKMTLDALHRILAVEFQAGNDDDENVDFRRFTGVVHLSPVMIRNLERLFIQSEQSMFKRLARRGIFLKAFAEMMELLYGSEVDQCPFHIDADTERKIRAAQQMLVQNLDTHYDVQSLAVDVELPKPVLKEGFYYVFGKSINEYVQDYRFEKAATMLESGKYLIKEVAFHIGYQNPSHFISAFKQRYGETPKQWLKQFNPQDQSN